MMGITARMARLLALALALTCATAAAAAPPSVSDDPVCQEGVWATQGDEQKYVCLTWLFRGKLYTIDQLEIELARLGRPVPVVLAPAAKPDERATPREEPVQRTVEPRNDPPAASTTPTPGQKRVRHATDDDDDDDDDC